MARVYVSFLGTGNYEETEYALAGRTMPATRFVQCAELEHYGPTAFDRVVILVTPSSKDKHWEGLRTELLSRVGLPEERLHHALISEALDASEHWAWFERLLDQVDAGDSLVIDLTHGFRIVPIVISAALGYLQITKSIDLEAVHYGALSEAPRPTPREAVTAQTGPKAGEVVDASAFYTIQPWADAVSRLIDNADAGKLAELAAADTNRHFAGLADETLVRSLKTLTDALRNIDVHAIETDASAAIANVKARMDASSSSAERQLLDLVVAKFASLVGATQPTGSYDRPYLQVQLRVATMLLEHGLLMQAFTVMRELVASIGLVGLNLQGGQYARSMTGAEGRKLRRRGDLFVNMLQFEPSKWRLPAEADALRPWFDRLVAQGIEPKLRDAVSKLVGIRNGFDHGWTVVKASKYGDSTGIAEVGRNALRLLTEAIEALPFEAIEAPVRRSSVFVNLTNHRIADPVEGWSDAQRARAKDLGGFSEIVEPPTEVIEQLSNVDPSADAKAIEQLAKAIASDVLTRGDVGGACVSGEPTLTLALVRELSQKGVRCYAATTRRAAVSSRSSDGAVEQLRRYEFVDFRLYAVT